MIEKGLFRRLLFYCEICDNGLIGRDLGCVKSAGREPRTFEVRKCFECGTKVPGSLECPLRKQTRNDGKEAE